MYARSRNAAAIILVTFGILSLFGSAQEANKRGGSLHYNRSRRILYYSWATVEYTINNPESRDVEVTIRMSPRGQRNITIYETTFRVGAGLRYAFNMPVTIGTVEEYNVDMFLRDRRMTDENSRMNQIRLAQPGERFIMFINDDPDIAYGTFTQARDLDGNYVNTLSQVENAPNHFAGYDNAHLVAFFRPDFNRMTSRQYKAIMDYVSRGGTLVMGDPQGIVDAWQTPLRRIMPVLPLRLQKLDSLDALTQIGGLPASWPDGSEFLESTPIGDGITTIHYGDFPLVRWRRYGLGRVGICAINPSLHKFQNEHGGQNFTVFWRHLLSFGGRISYASSTRDPSLTKAVDELTGIQIPKSSFIRNLVLIYTSIILACVILGFLLKKQIHAWIALAIIAMVCTQAIFVYAGYRQRHLAPKTATIIEFTAAGVENQSTEQLVSLNVKSEQTLDLINPDPDLLLRSLPPARRSTSQRPTAQEPVSGGDDQAPLDEDGPQRPLSFGKTVRGEDEELRDPLKISFRDGRASLLRLRMNAGKPLFFSSLHASKGRDLETYPLIEWLHAGPSMPAWAYPEDIRAEYALLACEAGYFPVTIRGGNVSLRPDAGSGMRLASPEYNAFGDFLTRANTPGPMLVIFSHTHNDRSGFLHSDKKSSGDDRAFSVVGRSVHMIPLIEDLTTKTIRVPYERIRIEALRTAARALKMHDDWTNVMPISRNEPTYYPLDGFLPPGYSHLRPNRVLVDFVPQNRGGNVEFQLFIKGRDQAGNGVELKQTEGNIYSVDLSEEQQTGLIDPANGHFMLIISAKPRRDIQDPIIRLRQNNWIVSRLRIAVEGELPTVRQGRL